MRKEESERRRWQAAELAEKVGRSEAEQLEVTPRTVRGTHTDRGNKSRGHRR